MVTCPVCRTAPDDARYECRCTRLRYNAIRWRFVPRMGRKDEIVFYPEDSAFMVSLEDFPKGRDFLNVWIPSFKDRERFVLEAVTRAVEDDTLRSVLES